MGQRDTARTDAHTCVRVREQAYKTRAESLKCIGYFMETRTREKRAFMHREIGDR